MIYIVHFRCSHAGAGWMGVLIKEGRELEGWWWWAVGGRVGGLPGAGAKKLICFLGVYQVSLSLEVVIGTLLLAGQGPLARAITKCSFGQS